MTPEFKAWPKIPRFNRNVTITEKIDGTNACVIVYEGDERFHAAAQSRTRIITPGKGTDNYGFAAWVEENEDELVGLGVGHHFGEWYGKGIQRGYGLDERRFALFNVERAADSVPACCEVVPVLWRGTADRMNAAVDRVMLDYLGLLGSRAVPGFMRPEGIVVYHHAARTSFKVLLEGDDIPKGVAA